MGEGRANPTNPLTLTLVQGSRLPTVYFDPKHSGATNALEHADHHSITHPSYPHQTVTVQHGLNLSSCTIATISIITHCTTSSRHPRNGAPAVATRKHAPIGAQATVETASTVGRWQDAGRDKSKRPQCAKCTRRTHAAANVHDKAQAEQP